MNNNIIFNMTFSTKILDRMKGFLYSQDGSYAFPLGPKVTTIGRENCDISINV